VESSENVSAQQYSLCQQSQLKVFSNWNREIDCGLSFLPYIQILQPLQKGALAVPAAGEVLCTGRHAAANTEK